MRTFRRHSPMDPPLSLRRGESLQERAPALASDGAMQWSAWDISHAASKSRPAALPRLNCAAKMASTGPPSRPQHDPPPKKPQTVSHHVRHDTRGGWHAEDTAKGCHELERSLVLYQRRLQQVMGLTRAEAQRQAAPKPPESREATARRRTDVACGGGRLWGRWPGRECGSPVQCQTTLDLHHSAGRAPAGTGLAGLGKPGRSHTAQDCASPGFGIAGAADGRWLYQLEAWYPGVDCRWHRTQGHQPSGPGRICRATATAMESPVLGLVQNLQGALLLISVFADDLMLTDGSRALTVSQSETSHC